MLSNKGCSFDTEFSTLAKNEIMVICFGNVLSDLGTERTEAFSHFKGSVRTQESHLPPVLRLYFFPFSATAS